MIWSRQPFSFLIVFLKTWQECQCLTHSPMHFHSHTKRPGSKSLSLTVYRNVTAMIHYPHALFMISVTSQPPCGVPPPFPQTPLCLPSTERGKSSRAGEGSVPAENHNETVCAVLSRTWLHTKTQYSNSSLPCWNRNAKPIRPFSVSGGILITCVKWNCFLFIHLATHFHSFLGLEKMFSCLFLHNIFFNLCFHIVVSGLYYNLKFTVN